MKFLRKIQEFISRLVSFYADGLNGTALPHDSPIYVERDIDSQVYQFLRSENKSESACYIFGSPQTGKSSLALRLSKILECEDNVCSLVCIKSSESNLLTRDLYVLLADQICKRLSLENERFNSGFPIDINDRQRSELSSSDIENLLTNVASYLSNRKLLIFVDDIHKLEKNCLQDFIELIKKANTQSEGSIFFILLGNYYPSNFSTISRKLLQIAAMFEIGSFSGECHPLQNGINLSPRNKDLLIKELLVYTQGQPFLTIYLLHLSSKYISNESNNLNYLINDFIQQEVIQNRDINYLLDNHFQRISDYFIRGDPQLLKAKFYALEIYKSLLDSSILCHYNKKSLLHKILIESGLAIRFEKFIRIANLVYKKVFDRALIESIQESINLGENEMSRTNYSIANRDFFFLIDSSASMKEPVSTKDKRQRFVSIRESVKGHIMDVLNYNEDGKKICNEYMVAFFNVPKKSSRIYNLLDPQSIDEKFKDVNPSGDTNVAATFKFLMSQWLSNRGSRDGAVVIYVDGLIDDRSDFITEIRKVASQLEHHSHLKILIVGIGDAINSEITTKWYFELDLNGPSFRDANNEPCNMVIFNRMDDVNDIGGVISAIEKQLRANPESGLPDWLEEDFPDLHQNLKKEYNL